MHITSGELLLLCFVAWFAGAVSGIAATFRFLARIEAPK